MTFDFTEVQYEGKTVAQAEADWDAEFASLTANAAGTPVVVLPIHDYGVAAWNTDTDTGTGSPYTTAMYTDFIQQAYSGQLRIPDARGACRTRRGTAEGGHQLHHRRQHDHRDGHPGPHGAGCRRDGARRHQRRHGRHSERHELVRLQLDRAVPADQWRHVHDQSWHHAGRCHTHRIPTDAGGSGLGHRQWSQSQLHRGRHRRCPRRPRRSHHAHAHRHRRNYRQPHRRQRTKSARTRPHQCGHECRFDNPGRSSNHHRHRRGPGDD